MPEHRHYNLMQVISCRVADREEEGSGAGRRRKGEVDYRVGRDMEGERTEFEMLCLLWKEAMLIMSGSRSGGSFWYWKPMCL